MTFAKKCALNRFAPPASDQRLAGSEPVAEALLALRSEAAFDQFFAGQPCGAGYERFRRNLLVAAWSIGWHEPIKELLSEGLPLSYAKQQSLAYQRPPANNRC